MKNPFEYEGASKFSEDEIIEVFIEDHNFSRFVSSKRNIFLVGERGTGKTMVLLYNATPIQIKKAKKQNITPDVSLINVYIPCNTPLTHRREYELLQEFEASVISEHFFVLAIMSKIVDTVAVIPDILDGCDESKLILEFQYLFDQEPMPGFSFFEILKLRNQRELVESQKALNKMEKESFYEHAISFSSGVVTLVNLLKKLPRIADSHFSLMIDDAQLLNPYQSSVLNSWIAYRENNPFSFKVATSKIGRPSFRTASGGEILPGHDFTMVDLEQPYQNQFSVFGKYARDIVKKRLEIAGINKNPEEFFPENDFFVEDLKACEAKVRMEAEKRYLATETKKITDYVYKYARAEYFRSRSSKANRPPYSGFETLVHISTGVIRNLLKPCFWMFDAAYSNTVNKENAIEFIPPAIQTEVFIDRSKKKWEWLKNGLNESIDCTQAEAKYVFQLFDNLAILFRERLLHHKSEPRAISFSISNQTFDKTDELHKVLLNAQKAQILYTYSSCAKDSGRRETYYVPNRILWPDRGLDPVGQHARVSIPANELWDAAFKNVKIPFLAEDSNDTKQRSLFDV